MNGNARCVCVCGPGAGWGGNLDPTQDFSAIKGRCCCRRTDVERVSVGRALVVVMVVWVVIRIRIRVLRVGEEG